MGTTTVPANCAPKSHHSHSMRFSDSSATRSPAAMPARTMPAATAVEPLWSSLQVMGFHDPRSSLTDIATVSPRRCTWAWTAASMVSGSRSEASRRSSAGGRSCGRVAGDGCPVTGVVASATVMGCTSNQGHPPFSGRPPNPAPRPRLCRFAPGSGLQRAGREVIERVDDRPGILATGLQQSHHRLVDGADQRVGDHLEVQPGPGQAGAGLSQDHLGEARMQGAARVLDRRAATHRVDEEDARGGAVAGAVGDEGGDGGARLEAVVALVDDGLLDRVEQTFALGVEQRGECLFLVGEDGVEGALAGARPLHDAVDAGLVVTALREAAGDGVEDAGAVALQQRVVALPGTEGALLVAESPGAVCGGGLAPLCGLGAPGLRWGCAHCSSLAPLLMARAMTRRWISRVPSNRV